MKTRVSFFSALALAAALPATADDITISITGIERSEGMVHWALFDSADSFDGNGAPVVAARSRADEGGIRTTLHDLPSGRYALRLFHDSNGNGELDRNVLGIPREGYGFSNDAGRRGPASFEDAAVTVDGDTNLEVRIR